MADNLDIKDRNMVGHHGGSPWLYGSVVVELSKVVRLFSRFTSSSNLY